MTTAAAVDHPGVEAPTGALCVDDWAGPRDNQVRYFVGPAWVVDSGERIVDPTVLIDGTQFADGTVERAISVRHAEALLPAQAEQLARVLMAAAVQAEQLDARGQARNRGKEVA